jgi:hypothetical protein
MPSDICEFKYFIYAVTTFQERPGNFVFVSRQCHMPFRLHLYLHLMIKVEIDIVLKYPPQI